MTNGFEIKYYTYEETKELYRKYNEGTRKSYEEWLKKQNKKTLDK